MPTTTNLPLTTTKYDPTLAGLIERTKVDWANPEDAKRWLISYKIGPEFDNAMWGVDLSATAGELITIQAPKKMRKTTFLANLILNFVPQLIPFEYWFACYTLESGMQPTAYRDVLIAMEATKMMIGKVYGTTNRAKWPEVRTILAQKDLMDEDKVTQLRLTKKYMRYGKKTTFQHQAIQAALEKMKTYNLSIFGPVKGEGQSRDLDKLIRGWEMLYEGKYPGLEGKKHRLFSLDHINQLSGFNGESYRLLQTAVPRISDFVVSHPGSTAFVLSQVSLTSRRNAGEDDEMTAAGGMKLAEESTTVFQTAYDRDKNPFTMDIQTVDARYEPAPIMVAELEPNSGVFLRPATPRGKNV